MRILVTGKSGQVSQSLQALARKHGCDIITIGRPEIDFENPDNLGAKIIEKAPDVVISAAAYTMVDKAEAEFETAQKINAAAPEIIATACKELDLPLLHLSTDYIFSGKKNGAYNENDLPNPQSIYGKTKLEGEIAIRAIHSNHVILRTSWVYSPFGKNFVKTMLWLGQKQSEISVVADQFGCPTYSFDIANALFAIANKLKQSDANELRGIFHLAGSGDTNWADFAKKIFNYSNMDIKVKEIPSAEYPTPARRPTNSRLDCMKLHEIYGIKLPLWQDSLKDCLQALKEDGK